MNSMKDNFEPFMYYVYIMTSNPNGTLYIGGPMISRDVYLNIKQTKIKRVLPRDIKCINWCMWKVIMISVLP